MANPLSRIMDAAATAMGVSEDTANLMDRAWDSAAMLPYWNKVDDLLGGVDAMKLQQTKYLPKFSDEEVTEYDFRLSVAKMTNIYSDIVESLAAKPFEEEITLVSGDKKAEVPEEIATFIEDVDGSGNNLTVFGATTFFNGINSAVDWILIDYPVVDRSRIRTKADQKKAAIRPFWTHVLGRNVLEARSKTIDGKEVLTYARIFEPGKPDHIRVFERGDNSGLITWKLYEKNKDGKFILTDEGALTIAVIPLVPFATGRRDGRAFKYEPPMKAAADLQEQLYRDETGLNFAKVMTAYPMLAANGIEPELDPATNKPKQLRVGANRVLYSRINAKTGTAGTWSYVEPSAQSLKFLKDDITETQQNLRELGRQPLTANSGNLTVITTAFAAGKAKSAVGQWALMLKDTLENALVITCMWLNITKETYDPEVNVYTEFDNFLDGGADLETLNKARENGDLSQETYWSELKRRKTLSPEFDAETERDRIAEEAPGNEFDDEGNDLNPDNPNDRQRQSGSGGNNPGTENQNDA